MLRKAIDYFCHIAVDPSFYSQLAAFDKYFMKSEYACKLQWLQDDKEDIYDPDYNDMLRVSFMHIFGRGKLGDLVSLLSGRDYVDRKFKEEIAEASFQRLSEGVLNFMNQYNFEQFLLAIKSAGFISPKLLNSKMTLDFAYALYLLLQKSGDTSKTLIKKYIQKWFVLSTLTSRYIGSPESQMDRDLRGIEAKGFLPFFDENEASMLSDDFWTVRLVQNLETSSVNSPYFNTFIASQIFYGNRSLLSSCSRVAEVMNAGDVHHLFPREYLKQNGIVDKSVYNQVANYTYLDTSVNISVGKMSPSEYFTLALQQCSTGNPVIGTIVCEDDFNSNLTANCIPPSIIKMIASDYQSFLLERRKLMAQRIREYYASL